MPISLFTRCVITAACCAVIGLAACRRAPKPAPATVEPPAKFGEVVEITSEYYVAFPGAEVDTATLEEDPTRLLQRTSATAEQVISYYRTYYTGRGWTEEQDTTFGAIRALMFMSEEGWVSLSVEPTQEGRRQVLLAWHTKPTEDAK